MRLPRSTSVRPCFVAARSHIVANRGESYARAGAGVQPSIDLGCLLSKAAQCLPVCLSGNVAACVACAGPGILSCL